MPDEPAIAETAAPSLSDALNTTRPESGTTLAGDAEGFVFTPEEAAAPTDTPDHAPAEAAEAHAADPNALPAELADNPFVKQLWEQNQAFTAAQEQARAEQESQAQQRQYQIQQQSLQSDELQAHQQIAQRLQGQVDNGELSVEEAQARFQAESRAVSAEIRLQRVEAQQSIQQFESQLSTLIARPEYKKADADFARSFVVASEGRMSLEDAVKLSAQRVAAIQAAAITEYEHKRSLSHSPSQSDSLKPTAAPIAGGGSVAAPKAPIDYTRTSISDALAMTRPQSRR